MLQCFDQITRVDGHVPPDCIQFPHPYLCDCPYSHIDIPLIFLPSATLVAAHGLRSVFIMLPICASTGMPHSDRPNAVDDGYNHWVGAPARVSKGQRDAEKPKGIPAIRSFLADIVLNDV